MGISSELIVLIYEQSSKTTVKKYYIKIQSSCKEKVRVSIKNLESDFRGTRQEGKLDLTSDPTM